MGAFLIKCRVHAFLVFKANFGAKLENVLSSLCQNKLVTLYMHEVLSGETVVKVIVLFFLIRLLLQWDSTQDHK